MKKKAKKRLIIGGVIAVVAVGGIFAYRNRNQIHGFGANLKIPSKTNWASNPQVILSEEVPIDNGIVSNLTDVANSVANTVYKRTNGSVKLCTTVISNTFSHPNSGVLQIDLSNVSKVLWSNIKSIAEQKMNMKGEIIGNVLEFS